MISQTHMSQALTWPRPHRSTEARPATACVNAHATSSSIRTGELVAAASLCGILAVAGKPAKLQRQGRRRGITRHAFQRNLSLDGYPIHGEGFYWTLSRCTGAVEIYMPIADDINSRDIVFSCRDQTLKFGLSDEKGGLLINDKLLYPVDINASYFQIEEGQYGERCAYIWLEKFKKESDWYAYDRFDPVSERFLLESEKKQAKIETEITNMVFFDIEINEKPFGRIVLGLYGKLAPRTVENFRCLCTGEKGESEETGFPLHYKGSRFHRVITDFCVQGGQTFETEDGDGGESIYGEHFEDESLRMKFEEEGLLAMATAGPDMNGSQFFITTSKDTKHLNHKCVGFGKVLEGYEVVKAIEAIGTEDGWTEEDAIIVDCGELESTSAKVEAAVPAEALSS